MSEASAAWLERRYLDWQRDRGRRATISAFVEWIGVSRNTYNNWIIKKQTPTGDSLRILGEKLGWEIYDIVGEPRPHPILQLTNRLWGMLTDDEVRAIERIVRRAEERGEGEAESSKPQPKRAR